MLARVDELAAQGERIVPQVPCRPTGMLFGLQSSLHPFITHPTYRAIAELPLAERVARLRDPAVRARLLAEEPATRDPIARVLMTQLGADLPARRSARLRAARGEERRRDARRARAAGPKRSCYDWMLERDGRQLLFAPLANYVDCDFEALREMMLHPRTVLGLSDGGAHCGLICDASMPTYLLTHWVRDRARGAAHPARAGGAAADRSNTADVYGLRRPRHARGRQEGATST